MSAVTADADNISMTHTAIEHVRRQLALRGTGLGVRLGVTKVGCSGYAYVVDFLDQPDEHDQEFVIADDVSVFVDAKSLPFVRGTELDYIRQGLNEGFEFNNPNVKAMCGCGESFSVA